MEEENRGISIFQGKKVRKTWHNNEWYFSVVDMIEVLADTKDASDYWYRLKQRELEGSGIELSTFRRELKLKAEDGKMRFTDCANTENALRIVQSIPSKNAEPFKLWLARVGYERIKEIEDPQLAQERMKLLYEQKGYSKEWIEKRLRGIAIRQELTGEWKQRGVEEKVEFAILTNEISKATFGKTVEEYKEHKGLKRENLRDHMDELELIFGMLGEKATTEIAKSKDAQGFEENKTAAQKGGTIAGNARKDLELETGKAVANSENYLKEPEKVKRKPITSKMKRLD